MSGTSLLSSSEGMSQRHSTCLNLLCLAGHWKPRVPLALRAAILRELVGVRVSIHQQHACVPNVQLSEGGKQGATETPALWNMTLDEALGATVEGWQTRRIGLDLEDGGNP